MERLKAMKNALMSCVEGEMTHLESANTHELGEAIDMIKDLEEAMYYHSIADAMKEEKYSNKYYNTNTFNPYIDKEDRRYEYPERKQEYPRDYREGRSPMRRKMYMESHELHKDKDTQMRELENYVQELTSDIMEMIAQATPEEKQMLQQKIMILANKIQ
ncbi:hypothetical protein [Megamonas funiformis]|uniref:hypothetical protein n=1 Tax=Megamonas funiformis TaxID=437897 RepID=UPI003F7F31F2